MFLIHLVGSYLRSYTFCRNLHKGPFIFYEVGGLVGFRGGGSPKKKTALKGGHLKNKGKGGVVGKNLVTGGYASV